MDKINNEIDSTVDKIETNPSPKGKIHRKKLTGSLYVTIIIFSVTHTDVTTNSYSLKFPERAITKK